MLLPVPELPDLTVYVEALSARIVGEPLIAARVLRPFVLRSVDPPLESLMGRTIVAVSRQGKRLVFSFENERWMVIHLMIAGRLRWFDAGQKSSIPLKIGLARFEFASGTLWLTEASTKRRASMVLCDDEESLACLNPGGIEPLEATLESFSKRLLGKNRTLKRALTDPSSFAGIGNAYSDEILHAARLSPVRLTQSLSGEEVATLYRATQETLESWVQRLRTEFCGTFPGPGQITAFHPDFAVHGKFGKPCPVCGMPVQRIRYAENETNYCARCQNEDRVLADRGLSRLLKDDWPRTLEEMLGER